MLAAVRAIQIEEVAQRVVRVLRLPQGGVRGTLAALRGLDTELQAQALVEVADVERQRAVVVRLRGGDAGLVQGADPKAKARVRVAARKSDLRVADGTGAE